MNVQMLSKMSSQHSDLAAFFCLHIAICSANSYKQPRVSVLLAEISGYTNQKIRENVMFCTDCSSNVKQYPDPKTLTIYPYYLPLPLYSYLTKSITYFTCAKFAVGWFKNSVSRLAETCKHFNIEDLWKLVTHEHIVINQFL